MSYNGKRMADIILEECGSIEERCSGYRETLKETIIEILTEEKQSQIKKNKIQQTVNSICERAGDTLYKRQAGTVGGEGG